MPRISSRTAYESPERSTSAAESVVPPPIETAAETPRPRPGPPDHVPSSVSEIAAPAARSPAPKRARAESCSEPPKASVRPGKSQSRRLAEAETFPGIVQKHDSGAAGSKTAAGARNAHTSSIRASPAPAVQYSRERSRE